MRLVFLIALELVLISACRTSASVSDASPGDAVACDPKALLDTCSDCWVTVPAGKFTMGSPSNEYGRALRDEDQVEVTLTHSFRMAKSETTQRQWNAMCLKNPSAVDPGSDIADCLDDECPVGMISFPDALAYANRLSKLAGLSECYALSGCTGEVGHGSLPSLQGGLACTSIGINGPSVYDCDGYRLPTEAEWEYVARAGTTTAYYSGPISDHGVGQTKACEKEPALEGMGWYCMNSSAKPPGGPSHRTRQFPPNPWGLFDMEGNADEWVSDAYDPFGYGGAPVVDPGKTLGASGSRRVLRGGKAFGWPAMLRAAHRTSVPPDYSDLQNGFRLVRTVK